jgi:hypothetical protein
LSSYNYSAKYTFYNFLKIGGNHKILLFFLPIPVILHPSPQCPINPDQSLQLVVVANQEQLLLVVALPVVPELEVWVQVVRLGRYLSGSKWVSDQLTPS